MTTSKRIVLVSYIIAAVLAAVTVIGSFKGYDVMPLSVITGAAVGEVTASNAFYFWKAKKENILKISVGAAAGADKEKVDDIVKIVQALGGIV